MISNWTIDDFYAELLAGDFISRHLHKNATKYIDINSFIFQDDDVPFGGDDGHDTLCSLMEVIQNEDLNLCLFFLELVDKWSFLEVEGIFSLDEKSLEKQVSQIRIFDSMYIAVDNAKICIYFTHFCLNGKHDKDFEEAIESAFKRQLLNYTLSLFNPPFIKERKERIEKLQQLYLKIKKDFTN